MKTIKYTVLVLTLLLIGYVSGPRPSFEPVADGQVDRWQISLDSLNRYVAQKDLKIPKLKPENESRIVWADSIRKTKYALVYLHGFSASPMESNPVHFMFARNFGMNMYLPLLAGHGLDDNESFREISPNDLINGAKEAIAIGQLLGDEVIVMSCSTGSTLSIYLAAANPELIDALIMYSPNFKLNDPMAPLLTGPWGEFLIKQIAGDYWNLKNKPDPESAKYWTSVYRTEGLIALQKLLDDTMAPEMFEKINQPYFIGYYYKNGEEKDHTISVDAILDFDEHTSTPDNQKRLIAFAEAGAHVIANPIKSNQSGEVLEESISFFKRVLNR